MVKEFKFISFSACAPVEVLAKHAETLGSLSAENWILAETTSLGDQWVLIRMERPLPPTHPYRGG